MCIGVEESRLVAAASTASEDNFHLIQPRGSIQRKRRNMEGMAFYRPTKHTSQLFFISSNKSKQFQTTKVDQDKDERSSNDEQIAKGVVF